MTTRTLDLPAGAGRADPEAQPQAQEQAGAHPGAPADARANVRGDVRHAIRQDARPDMRAAVRSHAHAAANASGGRRARAATLLPWLLPWLLPSLVLGGFELAVRAGWLPAHLMPPPTEVAATLAEMARNGLAGHVAASTLRVALGFLAGAGAGLALGALVALHRGAARLLDPSLQALRAIPSLAWVPLLLLWFGIDEAPKLILIAIGAFFPVYTGVTTGFGGVDRKLVEVGLLYRLAPFALVRRVLLPAALPAILTGLRTGLALAWMFMVAAELIAASRGLGYLLTDGRETGRADIVLAAIVLLAVLGKASDMAMVALERRLLAWRDSFVAAA